MILVLPNVAVNPLPLGMGSVNWLYICNSRNKTLYHNRRKPRPRRFNNIYGYTFISNWYCKYIRRYKDSSNRDKKFYK